MPRTSASLSDPALRSALADGLDRTPDPETARIAEFLAGAFGPSTLAIVHYGSRIRPADARPESAHDFFVILDRYADGYRSLASRVGTRYTPRTAALLSRVLPPNVIAVSVPGPSAPRTAKCVVLSLKDLARACSARARDHFAQARLIQEVQLLWSRDPHSRSAVLDLLLEARARTFDWGRCFLPQRFGVDEFCRVLLATSYASEIRPEGTERASELVAAQRETLRRAYSPLLQHLAGLRVLSREGEEYRDLHPPGRLRRWGAALYFKQSKVRSTLRWLKYVALYDDWLDYLVRKVERRGGVKIELTPRERRWPLIFLWPRTIRFILERRNRQP